jgi:hypothetical protein
MEEIRKITILQEIQFLSKDIEETLTHKVKTNNDFDEQLNKLYEKLDRLIKELNRMIIPINKINKNENP